MVKGSKAVVGIAMLSGFYSASALADGFYLGRASLSPGFYSSEVTGGGISLDGDGLLLAGDVGGAVGFRLGEAGSPVLLIDGDLEIATVVSKTDLPAGSQVPAAGADFEKTDSKLTVGVAIPTGGLSVTPFAGIRLSWQGSGVFSDDLYRETGFFIGTGVSGVKIGNDLSMSASLAYNATELEDGIISGSVDADGYSVKVSLRKSGSPHAYSLKYQTFQTDRDSAGADLKEGYLMASLTWYFMQGKM